MSCQDDLTTADLSNVSTSVLSRISGGLGGNENLYPYIDHPNISGINLDVPENASKIAKTWDERHDMEIFLDSGVDDQMIIHIPFTNSLRLRSLLLLPPQPTNSLRPARVSMFINLPHPPSFGDVEAMKPVQEFSIASSPSMWQAVEGRDAGGGGRREVEEWPLKVHKMANVFSVSLMISHAEGGERSRLYYVGFKGESKHSRTSTTASNVVPAADAAQAPVKGIAESQAGSSASIR